MKRAAYLKKLDEETFRSGDWDGFQKNADNKSLMVYPPSNWASLMTGCPNNVDDFDVDAACKEFDGNCQKCWESAIEA